MLHEPAIGIGIDQFSYHRYFGETGAWEQESAVRWSVFDFLQRARQLGVDAVSLQTVYLPELNLGAVEQLRSQLAGLQLKPVLAWGHRSGLDGGNDPGKVKSLQQLLPVARALGCSLVRLVCGDQFSWKVAPPVRIERLIPILSEVTVQAAELGLTLAIENHADFLTRDLTTLLERIDLSNLGLCFDTGNAVRVGDHLMEAAALAAPWIRMVHLKDIRILEECRGDPGAWWPSVPFGRGDLDLPRFVSLLRSRAFQGHLFIEMANMHSDWSDEDAAVAESVAYLEKLLD